LIKIIVLIFGLFYTCLSVGDVIIRNRRFEVIDHKNQEKIECKVEKYHCSLQSDSTGIYIMYDGIKISENFKNGIEARKAMTGFQKKGHCD